jgi:hypothetical protein
MIMNQSTELTQYVAEQVADYITSHTTGHYVTPDQMKILEKGVYAICLAGYPEHENILFKQVPKLIRTTLDMKQLDLTGKMQRIMDSAWPKNKVISDILGEITSAKTATVTHGNVAKDSWANKIHSEKLKLQNIER